MESHPFGFAQGRLLRKRPRKDGASGSFEPVTKHFGWMQTKLRRNSWLRRRLRAEDALEAFAVLKEDQYPQYRGNQSRSDGRRRKRQVKRKDVVEFGRQRCQRKWHEVARKQQQPTEQLNREEECGEVRFADGDKKLHRQWIRRRRLVDEVKKSVQPEDRKHEA